MEVTNIISTTTVNTPLDLARIAKENTNIIYNPRHFPCAVWRHRKINGTIQLFPNGKITHLGKPGKEPPKVHIRRFARILQKQGHSVQLSPIKTVCMSAVYYLSKSVNLHTLPSYEPEVLNAAFIKHKACTFCIFHSGKVIITGIRNIRTIYPALLELELMVQ